MKLGCLLVIVVFVLVPTIFVLSWGFVRTVSPTAPGLSTSEYLLQLETAATSQNSEGFWPITYTSIYPEEGQVRGKFVRRAARGAEVEKYLVVVTSASGASHRVGCLPGYRDACYFHADLRPARLRGAWHVKIVDAPTGRTLVAHRFEFRQRTSYSLVYWEGLMGI